MTAAFSETTDDTLLDGRLTVRQPKKGFRIAIDTVLLAASVPARDGDRVADLGSGVGGAALALACRVAGVDVTGLEADGALAALCAENAAQNDMGLRVRCLVGSVLAPPSALQPGTFDHVMMNPPYRDLGTGTPSPHPGRERANAHADGTIADWVASALRLVRPKGYVTVIYDAGGLDGLVAAFCAGAGDVTVFPLWPGPDGKPAKRVIVRARKGVKSPARMLAGLVLHGAAGAFTPEAEAVLRDAKALDF